MSVLNAAAWPAFLVDASALVQCVNAATRDFFGHKLEAKASLANIWTNENGAEPTLFLAKIKEAKSLTSILKLRGKGITITPFTASVCLVERSGALLYLFQLFPPSQTNGAPRTDSKMPSVEINLAQKQKLDCALQLTRTVALDFNNTLTAILGHATHVLGSAAPEHPWRPSLIEIEKAAERAAEVANQLAAFSSEHKDAYAQTTGNINNLLRRTVELFQTPQHNALAWSLQFEPKIFTVNHDEAKMQQAFVKILENAVQAIKVDGRVSVHTRNVELSAPTQDRTAHLLPGAYVCIEVSDNGCGIEPAVLPRVFEPFFTTKYGHRGLGLAWVYGIVTNHGGGVSISSQLGQGASVRVYLPAVRKVMEEKIITDDELSGKETVLVVDDEDMVLTMADMVLKSRGYRVLTATSGEKALKVLEESNSLIDLLVTDMVMPKMNGRELIEKIRAISPETRIVCATACSRSIDIEKQLDFLTKPFSAQQLLRKVREALTAQPA
ncbi:MAG TPA: ATP-binding protein [Methylomirabilota bacterium]|nr:ATP-binding protein [Methylomirabilota bacterium]